jgi:hypothetical protein
MSKEAVAADGVLIEHLWSSPFRKFTVDKMEACVSIVHVEMSHNHRGKGAQRSCKLQTFATNTFKVTNELQKGAATETARSLMALSLRKEAISQFLFTDEVHELCVELLRRPQATST